MQILALNIAWKLDFSPTGWVANDIVLVYWDTSTNNFYVTKNGVQITSGGDIPETFNYNGLSNFDYKNEVLFHSSICSSTDLLTFQRVSLFPYLEYTVLQDHPTCVIPDPDNPIVCDLQFTTLPTSTPATTQTSLDGSITVTATSSHGAIKFRLNYDFEFNDTTGQTSGIFSNLGPGIYQVYARDEVNCLSVITVEVLLDVSATYDTHYQLEFYNPIGHHIKVEILEKDYSGSIVDTTCGEGFSPLIFNSRAEGEKDKFIPIIATEMILRLLSETNEQYITLYTNDQSKYRLQVSIDTGSGYDVIWLGKILPNQYEENYTAAPYGIKVVATDGIPELKDITFSDANGGELRGNYKCIKLIAWILGKIQIARNIRVAVNMYADEMVSTDSDDPLDQAYVDVLRYYLFNNTPSCSDVLKMILETFGAQLIHYDSVWNIVRVEEKINSYDYREFDENGDYVSNSTYDPVKDIRNSFEDNSLHWMGRDQIMEIQPGFGSLQLLVDLGKKKNLFFNGDFAVRKYSYFGWGAVGQDVTGGLTFGFRKFEGTTADTTGFQIVSNGSNVSRSDETMENNNVALGFSVDEFGGYLQTETLFLRVGNADKIRLIYTFKIASAGGDTVVGQQSYIKVRLLVRYGDYYLLNDGTWSTTENKITYYLNGSELDKYQTLTILASAPENSYYLGESINVIMYFAGYDPDFTTLTALKALDTNPGGVTIGDGYRTELNQLLYVLRENTDTPDDITIVRPDDYNAIGNPYQWILNENGVYIGGNGMTLFIDKISLNILNAGRELPEVGSFTASMENENKLILNKIIYHGTLNKTGQTVLNFGLVSLPVNIFIGAWTFPVSFFYSLNYYATANYTAECGDIAFCGYLRDSNGDAFTLWSRTGIAEAKIIERIFLDQYTAQYNKPWRRISGGLVSHQILLTPLDCVQDFTGGGELKFYPPALTIDYRNNMYSAELLELNDAYDSDNEDAAAEFNLDVNLDFTS